MNKIKFGSLALLTLALAACGPADVAQTTNTAVAVAASAIPADIQKTAEAVASDPTTAALMSTAIAAANDPSVAGLLNDADLQALTNEALTTINGLTPSDLRLQSDQKTVLDTTQQVADVKDYRWVISAVPAGAEKVKGMVISENSSGKLTVEPTDYSKYFPVSGTYTVDLELTYTSGKKERSPITILVP